MTDANLGHIAELAERLLVAARADAETTYPESVGRQTVKGWEQLSAIATELVRIYRRNTPRKNVAADILVTVAERYGHDPVNAARVLLGRELDLDIVRASQLSRNGLTPAEVAEWVKR